MYSDPSSVLDEEGTRVCKKCSQRKVLTEFHLANKGRHRRRVCKDCCEQARKDLRKADPKKYSTKDSAGHLRRKYGLTAEKLASILDQQNNCCAICEGIFVSSPHVDHDHSCCPGAKTCGKCVRGILCFTCNTALGKFKDDAAVLRRAISYLEKYSEEN